jgi:hypothetical protein
VEILPRSKFPRFLREGEPVPPHGWAIEEFAQVFENGQPVGLFVEMQIDREGKSVLRHEGLPTPAGPSEPGSEPTP